MTFRRPAFYFASFLLFVVLELQAALALAEKTDLVQMENGNAIIGEVKSLDRGLLEYSVDDIVNRLQIKWDHVVRLTSDQQFDIELGDGSNHFGSLVESEADGKLRILTANGRFDVDRDNVVSIEPIEATFWKRLDGDISAGLSFTKSTDLLRLSLGGSAEYRRLVSQTTLSFSSIVTAQSDEESRTNSNARLNHTRFFSNRWFYRGDVAGARNDELGIDFRGTVAGGGGRSIVKTNRARWLVSALLSANREYTSDGRVTNNLELVLDTRLQAYRWDTPRLELDTGLAGFLSLTIENRFRVDFDGRLSLELGVKDFYWDIGQLYYKYDSEPSQAVTSKDDYGIVSALRFVY